jgi:hypothetical protein
MSAKNIVWLSSYPKSGNTWIRFQLLNLLYGPQETSTVLDKLMPDIHKIANPSAIKIESTAFIKSHLKMSAEMPLLDQTLGFIYIIRHPLDVMVSNLNYVYLTVDRFLDEDEKQKIKEQYIDNYIKCMGDPRWIRGGMGSWVEHVVSWLSSRKQYPNVVLRYEEMLKNPFAELSKLNWFMNLNKSDEDISAAIENSSFKKMKSIEDKEIKEKKDGFFYGTSGFNKVTDPGQRFMNKGESGRGKEQLSQDQYDAFCCAFSQFIKQLGY